MRNFQADHSIAEWFFLYIYSMSDKQRVIFYVDGFNFYFGLKDKKWKKFYWLDMVKFCSSFVKSHQELIEVNYFRLFKKIKVNTIDKIYFLVPINKILILNYILENIYLKIKDVILVVLNLKYTKKRKQMLELLHK